MPDKPDRPLISVTLGEPAYIVERFSRDKDSLESEWAQRFCAAYDEHFHERYDVADRAPDDHRGDVLLRQRREAGTDILLQITEVIDHRRLFCERLRKAYSERTWKVTPELRNDFKGIKIAVLDAGQMSMLPMNPKSQEGLELADKLGKFLLTQRSHLPSIPVLPPGLFPHPRSGVAFKGPTGVDLFIFLSRYAPVGADVPAQWLWAGPVWLIAGESEPQPHGFLAAIEHKVEMKYAKPARHPFWLLAYSVDAPYGKHQEAAIQSYLCTETHPFDRVFVLAQSALQQVFPIIGEPTIAEGNEGYFILGADLIPKIEDPRYIDIA